MTILAIDDWTWFMANSSSVCNVLLIKPVIYHLVLLTCGLVMVWLQVIPGHNTLQTKQLDYSNDSNNSILTGIQYNCWIARVISDLVKSTVKSTDTTLNTTIYNKNALDSFVIAYSSILNDSVCAVLDIGCMDIATNMWYYSMTDIYYYWIKQHNSPI